MSSLEERVEKIELRLKRMRRYSMIKNAVYAIIIIGVILYVAELYFTANQWSASPAGIPSISFESPTVIRVTVPVEVYNPSDRVTAKMIYYRVYVEGYYVGDGFIPYLDLPHGKSTHNISLSIDLWKAGCGLSKALLSNSNVTVEVNGFLMVDLRAFGVITWKTVTIPIHVSQEVAVPQLPMEAKALLTLEQAVCSGALSPSKTWIGQYGNSTTSLIQEIIQTIMNTTNATHTHSSP